MKALSFWEFLSAVEAYVRVTGGQERLSSEEAEALGDWLDETPVWTN